MLKLDREKTCPFLLRVFVREGGHHPDVDFSVTKVPSNDEYQLYAWKDSTVKELVLLLRDVAPSLRSNPAARYSLKLVFFDPNRDRYLSRDIATLSARDVSSTPDSRNARMLDKSLDDARFVIGDYIDVSYLTGPPPTAAFPSSGPSNAVSSFHSGSSSRDNYSRGGGFGPARGGGNMRGGGGMNGRNEYTNPRDIWAPTPNAGARGDGNAPPGAWGRNGGTGGGGDNRRPSDSAGGALRGGMPFRRGDNERRRDDAPPPRRRSRSPDVRRRSRSPPPHQRG